MKEPKVINTKTKIKFSIEAPHRCLKHYHEIDVDAVYYEYELIQAIKEALDLYRFRQQRFLEQRTEDK